MPAAKLIGRAVWLSPLLLFSLSPFLPTCRGDFDPVIDSPMYKSPDLPAPPVLLIFPEEARALWLRALERPDADTRCKAAETIALARQRGVKGLETTVAPLLAALDQADQHPAVRLAVARALVALDAREAASSLLRQSQVGSGDLREVVEPALARWQYQPASEVWLTRLADPKTPRRSLLLAIQGLGTLREAKAADRLRELALSDRTDSSVRLEAARALGLLRTEGLEKDAETLAADTSARGLLGRLAAVALLRQHKGEQTVRLLQRLSEDQEPAVVAAAVARLIEIDPPLVVPAVNRLLASPDGNVRSLAVEVLFRQPTAKHVELLAARLNDVHPDVRRKARGHLLTLAARQDLRKEVIKQATDILANGQWQGLEQATILLTLLDHKPAAARLVELLTNGRPEVYITAAWGLRRLDVPETLPGVLSHVESGQRRLRAAAEHPDDTAVLLDHQLSQLNQLLGRQKYQPADAALQAFIPRMPGPMHPPVGLESRAAAIWALGLLREAKPDAGVAAALEERLNDIATMPPEDNRVRWMCAITLGRTKAKDALDSLRAYCPTFEPTPSPVNNACGWAIEQLTGETMPAPKAMRKMQRDWFLVPDK
jgi:HEAT repeat protein